MRSSPEDKIRFNTVAQGKVAMLPFCCGVRVEQGRLDRIESLRPAGAVRRPRLECSTVLSLGGELPAGGDFLPTRVADGAEHALFVDSADEFAFDWLGATSHLLPGVGLSGMTLTCTREPSALC